MPTDMKLLKGAIGLFSYYSYWFPNFSEIVHPLVTCKGFTLQANREDSFHELKSLIENAAVKKLENYIPLVLETDASEHSLAASSNQAGRTVALFPRILSHAK